jgi:hypothetical protein
MYLVFFFDFDNNILYFTIENLNFLCDLIFFAFSLIVTGSSVLLRRATLLKILQNSLIFFHEFNFAFWLLEHLRTFLY